MPEDHILQSINSLVHKFDDDGQVSEADGTFVIVVSHGLFVYGQITSERKFMESGGKLLGQLSDIDLEARCSLSVESDSLSPDLLKGFRHFLHLQRVSFSRDGAKWRPKLNAGQGFFRIKIERVDGIYLAHAEQLEEMEDEIE